MGVFISCSLTIAAFSCGVLFIYDLIIDTVGFSLVIFLLVPSDFSSTALPLLPPFGIIEYFFSILV